MMRPQLSTAATALLRALIHRAGIPRDRILLREYRSTDWHSLTYSGERHEISLRFPPPHAEGAYAALTHDLENADFTLPGHIVADIAVATGPDRHADGSIELTLEALTLQDA